MILDRSEPKPYIVRFSRTRGCDPEQDKQISSLTMFFPHTRVWSHAGYFKCCYCYVFPAHAGVIPRKSDKLDLHHSFSRTRGGDPNRVVNPFFHFWFFPHTRVWSQASNLWTSWGVVFPAHVGVILCPGLCPSCRYCFSRTRGCDPMYHVLSEKQRTFFPHTRGIDFIKWDIRKISLLKTDKLEIGVFYYRKKACVNEDILQNKGEDK